MRLILTEKASVAREVARYLDLMEDENGAFVNKHYIVVYASGHLFSVNSYDMGFTTFFSPNFVKPDDFLINPPTKDEDYKYKCFRMIQRTLKHYKNKITHYYNFCDQDIEGQRIAEDIFWWFEIPPEKTYRMWTSDVLSKDLVLDLIKKEEPEQDYNSYYQSAMLRAYSDLVLGFNCSPMYSHLKNQHGLSIGRVQTPVLYEITKRYLDHENFESVTRYRLQVKINGVSVSSEELRDSNDLEIKLPNSIKVEQSDIEEKTWSAPKLYNKASLLIDANRVYKINASRASEILQDLYQNKKITSYPRTPSTFLDEKNETKAKYFKTIQALGYEEDSKVLFSRGRAIFDNSKITGHYALIIVNGEKAQKYLDNHDDDVSKILSLMKTRMLTRGSKPVKYESKWLTFQIKIKDEVFTFNIEGRRILEEGWIKYQPDKRINYEFNSWVFDDIKTLTPKDGEWVESNTEPPPIYTSGSIIKWMESVGIGAPSTIDSYASNLNSKGFIQINKWDQLIPTNDGIMIFNDLKDTDLVKPELTEKLEHLLNDIIEKNEHTSGFKDNKPKADKLIRGLWKNLKDTKFNAIKDECICGSSDVETEYQYIWCKSCDRCVYRSILGAKLTNQQMKSLFAGKKVWVKGMKSKKSGKYFSCNVYYDDENNLKFEF